MQTTMSLTKRPTLLVLCTGNSCRSHLAEGILRRALGGGYDVQSAGSKPAGYVHPLAVKVMAEIGIDISAHRSKHLHEFLRQPVETVITVCGNADQACPVFPGQVNRYHWGFDDPAHATGTEEEKLAVFRRVRDEIKKVFEAYAAGRLNEGKRALPQEIGNFMNTQVVQVYDPAMCCSTGACGPEVDPKLAQFAADLEWLKGQGVMVRRHSLSQSPAAFVENEWVRTTLVEKGEAGLPLIVVNGKVAVMGRYPERGELAGLAKVNPGASAPAKSGGCDCGGACG